MDINQIIGKMMGDGSMGDEKSALESWKKEAEENIKALEDIRKIATLSDSLKGYEDFGTDNGWEALESKLNDEGGSQEPKIITLHEETSSPKIVKKRSLNRILQIAAVAVLLLGAIILFTRDDSVVEGFQSMDYAAGTMEAKSIELVDGSQVTLDRDGKLRSKDERTVSLKGRAFFDVAKDESQQFKINLPVGEITVLGTEFSVTATSDRTEILVEEGKVAYTFKGNTYTLVAGEFIQVVGNTVERFAMKDDNYVSWKSQRLLFNDNTMGEVVEALTRHFGKTVELKDPKRFKNCNVKGTYDNPSLEEILNEFSTTHGLKYQLINDKYVVSSSKC